MIAHLRGRVLRVSEDAAVIDVGGVGYLVHCAARTLASLPRAGEAVELEIETQLRAESLTLYGFQDAAERSWFRLLQTVQGVGARVALALLTTLTPDQLASAVTARDKAAFSRANGVGPRLAQRLISELQSRVGELPATAAITLAPGGGAAAGAGGAATNWSEDAVSALVNLGYGRSEAFTAVQQAAGALGDAADTEALIRAGLKALAAFDIQNGDIQNGDLQTGGRSNDSRSRGRQTGV
jgi:Holliday junction DNA helicase RuvA